MNYKNKKHLYEDATNSSFEERVAYAKQQLQNGADPKDVFDETSSFHKGFARVKLDGKWNFLKPDGSFLREDLWFDYVGYFYDGLAKVELEDRGCNFIKPDGNFLREDLWFTWVHDFHEGFARVYVANRGENFINTDGNILRDDLWFDDANDFYEGFAKVKLNNKGYNFIGTDGNILRDDVWFDGALDFRKGFAWVSLGDNHYEINKYGQIFQATGFGHPCFTRQEMEQQMAALRNRKPNKSVTENKRRVVRLTESQLRNTIKRVVAQCLNERRIR